MFSNSETVQKWLKAAGMKEDDRPDMAEPLCDSCAEKIKLPMTQEQYKKIKRGFTPANLGLVLTEQEIEFLEFGVCHKCFDEDAIGVEI